MQEEEAEVEAEVKAGGEAGGEGRAFAPFKEAGLVDAISLLAGCGGDSGD